MPDMKPCGLVLGHCQTQLWSITGEERARRTLVKAGVSGIAADPQTATATLSCVMVRADWVVDPALIGRLMEDVGTILTTLVDGRPVPLAAHVAAADVAATAQAIMAPKDAPQPWPANLEVVQHDPAMPAIYLRSLRKRLNPTVMPLTPETIAAAEKATFSGAYKGVTDVVTKYVWPAPARWVTRWCARLGISPNMVTLASLVLVFVALALFAQGHFLIGLICAWVMTFLDTVDGKLARVTLTSTKFGNAFDHGIDMIHPPFWWLAWHWGCIGAGVAYPHPELSLAITFVGYIVLRLQEGAFIIMHGFQMHVWRRFDSLFRLIVARRNPNLIILTVFTLIGQPGWGMTIVAAWTAISMAIHAVQLIQSWLAARGHDGVSSWLAA